MIRNFEIDMLDVKAADACLIRFASDVYNKNYVVLVDAGNYTDGKIITEFVKNRYGTQQIDMAICTHCDKDHFGGFVWLLEQMNQKVRGALTIKQMVIIDPAKYIKQEDVLNRIKGSTLYKRARSVYDLNGKNLLDMLDVMCNIRVVDPLKDWLGYPFANYFNIIGPSESYYREKNLGFRNDLESAPIYDDCDESEAYYTVNTTLSKTLDDASDDSSSHNQSSIIFTFVPDFTHKFLFMGDAGREAFENVCDKSFMENVYWLKVPHHGSKHNMDSTMIELIHPQVAYISTEKVGHYLSRATVNALKKEGATVCSTHNNHNLWFNESALNSTRADYGPAICL